MLGIADMSKIFDLLKFIFDGDQKKSLESLRSMMNQGVEPTAFLNDLLEATYHIQQKKILGNLETDLSISQIEIEMIDSISKDIKISTLILFWQFILKSLDELSIVSNPFLSLEMLIIRLIHLKGMPSYEEVLESLKVLILTSFFGGGLGTLNGWLLSNCDFKFRKVLRIFQLICYLTFKNNENKILPEGALSKNITTSDYLDILKRQDNGSWKCLVHSWQEVAIN